MLQTRRTPFDIIGIDRTGQIALVVDVEFAYGVDSASVVSAGRRRLAEATVPPHAYLLVLSRTHGFLWKPEATATSEPAVFALPVSSTRESLYQLRVVDIREVATGFVANWLSYVLTTPPDELDQLPFDIRHWLVDSGLYAAMEFGSIREEIPG